MTPIDLIRDMNARAAAIRTYARAFDQWAVEEQKARADGRVAEAEGARKYAEWAMRAYRAEIDADNDPRNAA